MKDIKTSSGFECSIDPAAINDFELLEAVRGTTKDDPLALVDVVNKLLDVDAKKRLYDLHRDENGRVSIEGVTAEISEIFNGLAETKK